MAWYSSALNPDRVPVRALARDVLFSVLGQDALLSQCPLHLCVYMASDEFNAAGAAVGKDYVMDWNPSSPKGKE